MTSKSAAAAMHPREFVAFIAAVMAVNALGVDLMLPALADIGRDLAVGDANHRQWIITVYMVGFGAGQLVYGPLADRFGRRPILVCQSARKKDPLSASKTDPFAEQRDRYDGRSIRAGRGVGRA